MGSSVKIYVGKLTPEHKRDTSRELIDLWRDMKLCEVIEGQVNDFFLWAKSPGDVLLYEYDRWDVFPGLPPSWRKGLFGGMQHSSGLPWIYWARRPKMLHNKIECGLKSFDQRAIESIFLGKIENGIQHQNRTRQDWSKIVEFFSMPVRMGDSFTWPYTQEQYLEHVSNSKFGLCLPGYGPKCNREVEYLGLGVVPLITEGVDTRYYDPLIEGKHYFKVNTIEDVKTVIKDCSKDRWEYMSYNCRKWYEQNCSPVGSFETTMRIVESL
jgi:hypothetical protein